MWQAGKAPAEMKTAGAELALQKVALLIGVGRDHLVDTIAATLNAIVRKAIGGVWSPSPQLAAKAPIDIIRSKNRR